MPNPDRNPVLSDHVRVKQKLLSPFLARVAKTYAPYSWNRELVPEAIWLALIIDRHGFEIATQTCVDLITTTDRVVNRADAPMFAKLSAFAALTAEQSSSIVADLPAQTLACLHEALSPLSKLIPQHPLFFLKVGPDQEISDEERFGRVLDEVYDRDSRLSVLSMALAFYLGNRQGKLHISSHLFNGIVESFAIIGDYPSTEAARQAAGRFRAAAPMLFMTAHLENKSLEVDKAWSKVFWEHVAGFGACAFEDSLHDEPLDEVDGVDAFVIGFRNAVKSDLRARLSAWMLDLNEIEQYEVLGALLARQANLAFELAGAPALWTPHSAPILLRAMADVFISMAWIMRAPSERAKLFVEDGLGAVKLMIAHQERAVATTQDPAELDQMQQMLDLWRAWLTSQRLEIFVEVNLGSWSGINTRRMAEEAGFLDFYNHVYQPFSSAAHSNWFHVSAFNTTPCQNPAHRGHRVPTIVTFEPDTHWLMLAAKYLRKTLAHFDEVNGLTGLAHSAYDYLFEAASSNEPAER